MGEKKKVVVDHYRVLGLPSGKEGTKLNETEITKAYRAKALQLHPDKRPNDPNAKADFQRLNSSYEILRDPNARKKFDSSLVRLGNKPSSSEPKKKTAETEEKWKEIEDELFVYGFFIIVLAPMIFPVARTHIGFVIRSVCLILGIDVLSYRQQTEKVLSMICQSAKYFKRNLIKKKYFKRNPRPPQAATDQESQGDDHEDIEAHSPCLSFFSPSTIEPHQQIAFDLSQHICNFWLPQLPTLKTLLGFFTFSKTLSRRLYCDKGTLQYNPSWFLLSIMFASSGSSICCQSGINQPTEAALSRGFGLSNCRTALLFSTPLAFYNLEIFLFWQSSSCFSARNSLYYIENNQEGGKERAPLMEEKRLSLGLGKRALNLVRIVSDLPNEKEAIFGALDKWTAWETEFPLIAAAKALRILRKRNQWMRVIQVAKWMLSKGQGATMATYDTLLLAFDMDHRVDEAESLWNMILHTHTRSISKRLFSRMISLYDHHEMKNKIIEVFADMEELSVRPDEDTVRRVARAFQELGQEDEKKLVLRKYGCKWKYIHFKGERVKVRTNNAWDDDDILTN
ncbi:hypothetical protein M0R45_013516 [Rubus argutus]|uniref:J domain-containing protein n=1 Tax=Rubus argutus TaxID=59490 RepID=A0AAW1XLA1_RUBAR